LEAELREAEINQAKFEKELELLSFDKNLAKVEV